MVFTCAGPMRLMVFTRVGPMRLMVFTRVVPRRLMVFILVAGDRDAPHIATALAAPPFTHGAAIDDGCEDDTSDPSRDRLNTSIHVPLSSGKTAS